MRIIRTIMRVRSLLVLSRREKKRVWMREKRERVYYVSGKKCEPLALARCCNFASRKSCPGSPRSHLPSNEGLSHWGPRAAEKPRPDSLRKRFSPEIRARRANAPVCCERERERQTATNSCETRRMLAKLVPRLFCQMLISIQFLVNEKRKN